MTSKIKQFWKEILAVTVGVGVAMAAFEEAPQPVVVTISGEALDTPVLYPQQGEELFIEIDITEADSKDNNKRVTLVLQYEENGQWHDHLQVAFQGGKNVQLMDGDDGSMIMANTSDVRALKGKTVRLRALSPNELKGNMRKSW